MHKQACSAYAIAHVIRQLHVHVTANNRVAGVVSHGQVFQYFIISAISSNDVNFKAKCRICSEKEVLTYVAGTKKATSNFITHLEWVN